MARRTDDVHQLKVTLEGIRPPIWRRLLVGSGTTLSELHDIVQAAMGWEDYHLHVFEVAGRRFGEPDPDFEVEDESEIALGEIVASGIDRFRYEYDFGDGWVHEVRVEKTAPSEASEAEARIPRLVAGRRACPPEDCGGVWGYADLLDALADPEQPGFDEKREWLGDDFDPEAFDLEAANARLERFERGGAKRRGGVPLPATHPPRLLWLDRFPERCPEDDASAVLRAVELRIEFPDDRLELDLELGRCSRDGTWFAPYPLLRQVVGSHGLELDEALELSLDGEVLQVEVWAGDEEGAVPWDEMDAPVDEEPELPTAEALERLSVADEAWSLAHGPAGVFLDDDGHPVRSHVGMVADAGGAVRRFSLLDAPLDTEALGALALRACASPMPGFAPARPRRLHVDDAALAAALGAELEGTGIRVAAGDATPALEAIASLREAIEPHSVPPYFARYDEAEVTAFFRAAASFFRAEPWEVFDDRKFLAFRLGEGPWRYAGVMGQAGLEFGLAMFGDWLEVCRTVSESGPSLDPLALLKGRDPEPTNLLDEIGIAESLTLGGLERIADEDADLLRRLRVRPAWRGEYPVVYRFTPEGLEPPAFEPAIYAGLMELVAERAGRVRGDVVTSVTARVATSRGELRVRYPAKGDEGSSGSGCYRVVLPFARWESAPEKRMSPLRVVVEAPGEAKWHRVMERVRRTVRGREGVLSWVRGVMHEGHYIWAKHSPLPAISPTMETLAALPGLELQRPDAEPAALQFEAVPRPPDATIRVWVDEE